MGILGHSSIGSFGFLTNPSIRYYSYNRKSLILNDYKQYIFNLIKIEQTQINEWLLSYRISFMISSTKRTDIKKSCKTSLFNKKQFFLS
jgi:hypothetical protein